MMRCVLVMAALLAAGASPVQAAECGQGAKPIINIIASESEPSFDYNLSQEQLGRTRTNNSASLAAVYDTTVNAMSVGKMDIKHSVSYTTQATIDKQVCLRVAQVDLHIHISPVIFIASELQGAPCEYKEYLLHEMKHVEADRKLVEDYKAIIVRNMDFAFPETKDYSTGPLPPSLTKDAQQVMTEGVIGVLQASIDSMLRERQERQRAIDNNDEYLRLSRACLESGLGNRAAATP